MQNWLVWTSRILATALVVTLAVFGGRWLWIHYNVEPWTRDGRVRADIVQVSPDVSALVTEVRVQNNQTVPKGDVLFVLDRPRFGLALRQAEAALASAEVALAQAKRENERNRNLKDLATTEQVEEGQSKVDQLVAQLNSARVQRDVARLNLDRTTVYASVDGIATNVELRNSNRYVKSIERSMDNLSETFKVVADLADNAARNLAVERTEMQAASKRNEAVVNGLQASWKWPAPCMRQGDGFQRIRNSLIG